MANQLKQFVADNKSVIEAVMDVFEKGAEVVASVAGDMFPVFAIAAPIVKMAMDNVESKEAKYMTEQFQKVRDRLEVASEEVKRINDAIKKSYADITYFSVEENLTNQFLQYMNILKAKPDYREVNKEEFLDHFNRTGGDKNLMTLFEAVNASTGSVLEITLNHEQKNRRAVEDFCARLKELFCVGLIALMGYNALKWGDDAKDLLQEWGEKMKIVQSKMTAAIEDCINSFPELAEKDVERLVHDNCDKSNKELADTIIDTLKKKYDWVHWSVRVFNSPTSFLSLFTNKKEPHCFMGHSHLNIPSVKGKSNVMVSYSASPEPLNKDQIQLIASQKTDFTGVAKLLFEKVPTCMVQTINISCKDVACSYSFSEELHYWEKLDTLYVCVHSA